MFLHNMTRLEAVNAVLNAIGDTPINTLEDDESVEVSVINEMIDFTSRSLQSQGWDFNTITEITLTPDIRDNKIVYPKQYLHIENSDPSTVLVQRGDYLYNMTTRSYTFTSPIVISAIEFLDFDDLPHQFRYCIAIKVAKEYQERYLGDQLLAQELTNKLSEAHMFVLRYDVNRGNYNILSNTSVATSLQR